MTCFLAIGVLGLGVILLVICLALLNIAKSLGSISKAMWAIKGVMKK